MSGGWLVFMAIVGIPGFGLMLLGLRKRRRTLRVVKVWNQLEADHDVPVDHLLDVGSFEEDELIDVLARINRATPQAYLLDEKRRAVIDSRLRGRAVVVERCAGCGAPVNLSVEVGRVEKVTCPTCGGPVAGSARELLERAFAQAQRSEPGDVTAAPSPAHKRMGASGLGQLAVGVIGCLALPLIMLSLSFGLALAPPLIGALVLWEVLRHRLAPSAT
jgi:hypothetical protein